MELTKEIFDEIMNNISMYDIEIPELYYTPYVVQPILLGSQQYYLEYFWNNRYKKVYLSIYRIQNNQRIYFAKSVCLIKGTIVSDKIKNTDWNGCLIFDTYDNVYDTSYTIKDISEKFRLQYTYSEA